MVYPALKNVRNLRDKGIQIGRTASELVGFFGATAIARPSGAAQAALTNSTTGSAGTTLAAGVGVYILLLPIALAGVADGDVLTAFTLGHKFKILGVDFAVTTPVTTADKLSTLNLEIGSTDLTGGAVALTSANCTPLGAVVAGSAVTGANTGAAGDTISVEASSTTAFAEGAGVLIVRVQNMDTADAVASLANLANGLRTAAVNLGLVKGAA